jgi:ATP-dependent Clp protease ATP-binding subunit ClpC
VREGEGIAVNVLRSLGVSLDKVRTATAKSLLESEQTQERKKQESKTP